MRCVTIAPCLPQNCKTICKRKLYDTERSCYVTLDDIAVMIRSGEEVTVVDNKSGEDLTSVTLAQIIFETEKKPALCRLTPPRNHPELGESIGDFARGQVETFRNLPRRLGAQRISFASRLAQCWKRFTWQRRAY